MPICPKCSATIHRGAEDACPACGYDISQADEIYGEGLVEFTRVVDAAGALTHQERSELMHALEQMERKIRPVALCIYITDVGQAQELRTHAHWILNHARIHHPSFGKRELHKAIEDADLLERRPGEARQRQEEPCQSWLGKAWQAVRDYVMDALHPLPPPVKHEWMLILVMDVQLEMACFSWGYKLDPYIDPDRINTCIKCARLQFRERAMVTALKKVMKAAARSISSGARKASRRRRRMRKAKAMAMAAAGALLCCSPAKAQQTPPAPQQEPAAASAAEMPHWRADDYRNLMSGELLTGYTALFPPKPTPEEIKAEQERQKELRRQQRELRKQQGRQMPSNTRPPEKPEESDTRVLGRYCEIYTRPPHGAFINDPQGLLNTVEREDIDHVLRTLNANAKFRIYVSVFKGGQDIPSELSVDMLVTATAQPCEYAVVMRFPTGNPAGIELGYQEIKPEEAQRLEWLQKVRQAAGDGSAEGLMDALRCLSGILTPLADNFTPIAVATGGKVAPIDIEFRQTEQKKKKKIKDYVADFMNDPVKVAAVAYPLGTVVAGLLIYLLLNWMRSSSKLESEDPDIRLSSPYGAGVSRYVRYLEGTEAGKEKTLF